MVLRLFLVALLLCGCSTLERDNVYDPYGKNYGGEAKSSSSSGDQPSSSSADASSSSGSSSSGTQSSSNSITLIDSRDGKSYRTVVIGTQTWMAENLNYAVVGSKCGNDSDLFDVNTTTCNTYGRLYDWEIAVTGICPEGWRLPSYEEWEMLITYVENQGLCTACAGTRLKAASGWNSGNGTDNHGFVALPGGSGDTNGLFTAVRIAGYWWSATPSSTTNALYLAMSHELSYVYIGNGAKRILLSVRCVMG